jgi:GNAT superfamily N-acetyltransferase
MTSSSLSMTPLTATASLAKRIDHTELALVRGMAESARAAGVPDVREWPIGGSVVVLSEPGSPFNKLIGLGFGEEVDVAALDAIEREHHSRNARLQVEFSALGDPAVTTLLTSRGYRLVGFENVLARRLQSDAISKASGVSVSPIDAGESALWRETVTSGVLHPDVFDGPASHESFDRAALERTYDLFGAVPGVERLLARLDGVVAGGASLYIRDGIALMCGAATLPALRRRGVQSALLHARLDHARQSGCDLAVVTTQPGSRSQQNVQRMGFDLIYARAILVKDPGTAAGH